MEPCEKPYSEVPSGQETRFHGGKAVGDIRLRTQTAGEPAWETCQ